MGWDFSTEPEYQGKLDWVEQFCREEVDPLDLSSPTRRARGSRRRLLVRGTPAAGQGPGAVGDVPRRGPGGPGLRAAQLGLLNEILGRYPSAPVIFGTPAPDTGNMEMLAAYGTGAEGAVAVSPDQPGDLVGLLDDRAPGRIRPDPVPDPAVRDGDEWVINGEKWFTSSGRGRHPLVMCRTASSS